jgi:hypothetical protein
VHRFLNFVSIFYFNLSNPSGIAKHDLLCVQLADSAGKLLPGLQFKQILLYLLISEFCFIFYGSAFMVRMDLHNRWMKTPLLLCLKGLLGPFCFCSKRYLIPFCRMQKGISYRLQNPKKSAKIKVYFMRCSITLWQFAKRAQITFSAVAKGNLLPFWLLCMRNPRIACNADHVLPYRWENKK